MAGGDEMANSGASGMTQSCDPHVAPSYNDRGVVALVSVLAETYPEPISLRALQQNWGEAVDVAVAGGLVVACEPGEIVRSALDCTLPASAIERGRGRGLALTSPQWRSGDDTRALHDYASHDGASNAGASQEDAGASQEDECRQYCLDLKAVTMQLARSMRSAPFGPRSLWREKLWLLGVMELGHGRGPVMLAHSVNSSDEFSHLRQALAVRSPKVSGCIISMSPFLDATDAPNGHRFVRFLDVVESGKSGLSVDAGVLAVANGRAEHADEVAQVRADPAVFVSEFRDRVLRGETRESLRAESEDIVVSLGVGAARTIEAHLRSRYRLFRKNLYDPAADADD